MILDDELLERAAKESRDRMLAELPEQPQYEFSDLFEHRMEQLLREDQKARRQKNLIRWSRRAAVFMLAGFVGLSVCVLSVDAWRVKLFEMIEKKNPEYSEITYERVAESSSEPLPEAHLTERRPAYIPEGYQLVEQYLNEAWNQCSFSNAEGDSFSYSQTVLGIGTTAINTEGSQLTEFEMNGDVAYKMSNRGAQFVLWSDEQYEYMVVAQDTVSLDEAVKIAASTALCPSGAYHPPHLELPLTSRPLDYSEREALENGDIVLPKEGSVGNPERLERFFALMAGGKPAVICIADYTGGVLLTHEVFYDGFRVRVNTDVTRKAPDDGSCTEGRHYQTIVREQENGETVLYGMSEKDGAKTALFRYREA